MKIHEIKAKSILNKAKRVDSWFLSAYGMNLYRGCLHNCAYCDGRAEKYGVQGDFGAEVSVKVNAVELLEKALNPKGKRTPFRKGFIFIGGGVGDSYQPIEKKYRLTRQVLELLSDKNFPIHIITKSDLVLRDIDLLQEINSKQRVIVSFSLSSASDELSGKIEPGAVTPSRRLAAAVELKKKGIYTGVYLLPVIPYVTDTPRVLSHALHKISEANVDFMVLGGMTLKEGKQKEFFYGALKNLCADLIPFYDRLYTGDRWGNPNHRYYQTLSETYNHLNRNLSRRVSQRIPPYIYKEFLSENDRAAVMLEHIDFLLKSRDKVSNLGYAAYNISQLKEPLSTMTDNLRSIKGVNREAEELLLEIIQQGNSSLLDELLNN